MLYIMQNNGLLSKADKHYTEYTMVYSSLNSNDIISRDIDEGDTVKIEFGVKSKYIFDICEFNISP